MLVKNRFATLFAYIVGALLVWAVVGCGGSGSSSGNGVAMKISWPAPSRYLPTYARSIVFSLYEVGFEEGARTLTVNRPETLPLIETVKFEGPIPSGTYVVSGQAKTGANGLGDTVSSAFNTVFVPATGTTTVAMTLSSTLSSLTLLNVPMALTVGDLQQLIVVVTDKDGNQVLLPEGALTWSLLFGGDSVSLSESGFLTANAAGTARVRVSEVGANLYSEGDITVFPQYGEGIMAGFDRVSGVKLRSVSPKKAPAKRKTK